MRLLAQRIPLTLLLDLLAPPDASEVYQREGVRHDRMPGQRALDLGS